MLERLDMYELSLSGKPLFVITLFVLPLCSWRSTGYYLGTEKGLTLSIVIKGGHSLKQIALTRFKLYTLCL